VVIARSTVETEFQKLLRRIKVMEQAVAQDAELARKLKELWDGLSPYEQARLDDALDRLIEEAPGVTAHVPVEYSMFLWMIAHLILIPQTAGLRN
jgi:hypothetical protein